MKNSSLDTGWIIRPSKRFPGNYYYFNVRTGEAAWTVNEADIKNLKKDANIKKMTNHPDCEPDTPPEDTCYTVLNTSTTKETINQDNENTQQHSHPMFGKTIFSKPLNMTSDDMNNLRWAPVQFMIHTNIPMPYTNTPNTDLIDKHLVHASEIPMNKRFKNFNDPAILFRKDNIPINDPESPIYECKESPIFDKEVPKSTDFGIGTSKCSFTVSTYSNYKMDKMPTHSEFEMTSPKRPEGSKSSEGSNFETSTPKSDTTRKPRDFEFGIKKSMMNKDSGFEMNESNNANEESTLYGYNRSDYECKNLDRNDLRHLLIAKRKQIEDASKIRSKKSKLSTITNVMDENTKSNPKTPTKRIMIDDDVNTPIKKVTFNDNPIMGRPKTVIFDYNNIPDCPKVVFNNEVPTAKKVIFEDNDPRKVTLDKDTDTRKVIFNKDNLKKVSWAKSDDTRKVILDKKNDPRNILDNNNDPKKITLQQETDPRKVTLQLEIDQRKITLLQEHEPRKVTLQQENDTKQVTLQQENDPRKFTLQQEDDPRKVTLQQEHDPRRVILDKNNESRKVTWAKNYILDKNDPIIVTLDKDDTMSYTEDIGVLSFSTKKAATIEPRLTYDVPKTTTSHDKLQWCLVADSEVLLNYIEEIDKIVEADKTCRLLVPYAVRSQIADICTMECRGQQRVLNARQTMRRLEQVERCIVEQLSDTTHTQTSALNTEDSIINCCVRARNDYFSVVLITNNPNLLSKAKSHSISCYTVFDILNGVQIKPNLISELKKITVLVRNGSQATNFDSFPVHMYKKELFKNRPSQCDTQTYNENIFLKSATESITELRQDTDNVQSKVQNSPPQNENDDTEPLKSENLTTKLKVAESNLLNFDKDIKKLAFHSDTFHFYDDGGNAKPKQDTDIQKSNLTREIYNKIREELSFRNVENIKKIFDSTTQLTNLVSKENTDIKRKETKNKSIFDPPSPSPKEMKDAKPKTATQTRAEKIIKMVNPSVVNTESKSKHNSFKIPQAPLKKGAINTSAPAESSDATDKFVPILNMATIIDEKMKELKVKDGKVLDNLTLRIDEWICTYTQIMEDILNSILEFTNHKMRTTHHFLLEVIAIIRMAYKNHTGIAYIVDKLHNNIQNSTNTKGLLKPSIKPEVFMQIFGESVILIQSLKTILPHFQNLSDAENNLQCLLENIEARQQATEPELSDTPPLSTELEDTQTTRANFKKDLSYVKDYLKKNFKHWASYQWPECKEENDNSRPVLPAKQSVEQPEEQDLKVFRTYGKHLNMLKINQNKKVFVDTKNLGETYKTDGPKIQNICDAKPSSDKCIDKDKEITEVQNNETIEIASTLHSNEDSAKEKYIEICDNTNDLPTTGNTLANIKETAGPKLIRNLKIIDEYEDKIRNRPTLDLDMLDYSEILESSINDLSEIYLSDVMKKNVSKECDKKGCEMITKKKCNETHKGNDENDEINLFVHKENINIQDVDNAFYAANNQNYATNNQNYATDNQNYANDNYYYVYSNTISSEEINHNTIPTHYNNNGAHNRNYATRNNENYAKIEDSDDSGFENESIYAQSLVKIFLSELSASFKVIYEFINKFMTNIHKNDFADETKLLLQDKAKNALDHIIAIIQSLKSIIRRESAEDTILKSLLHKAGIDCFNDKGIMGYREIVQKSLEQAQILEHALRIVVNATNNRVTPSVTSLSSTIILNSNT